MTDWEHIASIVIPGRPKPKGRPRFAKGHAYTPKETRDAEQRIVDLFEFECPLWEPTVEKVRLTVDAYFKNRQSCDLDNVAKLVSDALNKVAYADDRQIGQLVVNGFEGAGDTERVVVSFAIFKGERP